MVATPVDLSGVSILVVDDDADVRDLMELALARCGAIVRAAASARDAVLACEQQSFYVFISDLSMPDADGYALLRALKLRPQCIRTPVIAVTGLVDQRQRALLAGFDLFLVKPIQPLTLCRCVKAMLA